MKKQMRIEFALGLLLISLSIILNRFFNLHHFIQGALLGLGIALEVVGSLSDDVYDKLKQFKNK